MITSLDDPRVAPYRNLKDRELAREGDRFIAEGEQVVRRLIASNYQIESILIADRRLDELRPIIPEHTELLVAPSDIVNSIIGFKFHSGVMACGFRGERRTVADFVPTLGEHATIVALEDLNNSENLGSIIRLSAGFGVDAVVLGEQCADPFFRRSIRVSMGTVFHIPLILSSDLLADLSTMKSHGIETIASVLGHDPEPLDAAGRRDRVAICFGSEAQGIADALIRACDRRVTIPMRRGTDSLNVSVAAGIFLYHFVDRCGR